MEMGSAYDNCRLLSAARAGDGLDGTAEEGGVEWCAGAAGNMDRGGSMVAADADMVAGAGADADADADADATALDSAIVARTSSWYPGRAGDGGHCSRSIAASTGAIEIETGLVDIYTAQFGADPDGRVVVGRWDGGWACLWDFSFRPGRCSPTAQPQQGTVPTECRVDDGESVTL